MDVRVEMMVDGPPTSALSLKVFTGNHSAFDLNVPAEVAGSRDKKFKFHFANVQEV